MFDPDATPQALAEGNALDSLLAQLDGENLGNWDRNFVDDLMYKLERQTVYQLAASLTARQRKQLNRMKDQYYVKKAINHDF